MFDFFISHNKAEKVWARQLAAALKQRNIKYFFDEESIGLGENVVKAIDNGLKYSKHIVLILSPDSVKSPWVELEWASSVYADADASARKIIPIVKARCDIPYILRRLNYLDAEALEIEVVADELQLLVRGTDDSQWGTTALPKSLRSRRLCLEDLAIGPLPVTSRHYLRREADLRIEDRLNYGGSVVVFGPRKVGKTSLLHQVSRWASLKNYSNVFVDLQPLVTQGESAWVYILYSISDKLKKKWRKSSKLPLYTQVSRFIGSITVKQPLVILFDEFDSVLRAGDSSATHILRALINDPGRGNNLRIVCTTIRHPASYPDDGLGSLRWTPKMRQLAKVEPCP
jgi:hypothetical protein